MTHLYKDSKGTGFYILHGDTLRTVPSRLGRSRVIAHTKVNHKSCIAIGLVLVGTNFKRK